MHHMFMTLEASQRVLFEWIEWYIIDHAYQSVVYIWKWKTKQKPFSEPTLWASSHHKHLIKEVDSEIIVLKTPKDVHLIMSLQTWLVCFLHQRLSICTATTRTAYEPQSTDS